MFDIDFKQTSSQVIVHPEFKQHIPKILEGLKNYDLKDHFILLSSGTTGGDLKGYAISRTALFANAKATNEYFGLTSEDVWGLSLPVYHIGGLSVLARAHLLQNKVIDLRQWNPETWITAVQDVSITTIVPTQLYDLVKRGLNAPTNLRYLVVGGDFLSSSLKAEAVKLGWPVIRTFGMSEVSSQLASTKNPASDELEILPIHETRTGDDERLLVRSSSLFTLQFTLGNEFKVTTAKDLCDKDGFYPTSDRATLIGRHLRHLGRMGEEVKIAGHLVNMNQLKNILGAYLIQKNIFGKVEFMLEDDERKGKRLVLLTLPELQASVEDIALLIHPVKIDAVKIVETFDRTSLGKLKMSR